MKETINKGKGIIIKSFWTTSASMAFAFYSLAVNKLFSIYFGPQGVTLLAHFQNIVAIFTTLPGDGINRGVVRFMSVPQLDNNLWKKYFSSSILLNIVSFLAIVILLGAFFNSYKSDFPYHFFTPLNIAWVLTGTFFHLFCILFVNLILVEANFKAYALFSIINNMLALALVYYGLNQGLTQSLIALSFAPASVLLFMVFYYWKINSIRFIDWKFSIDTAAIFQLGQFMLIAVSGLAFGRLVDFFVRSFAISRFDLYETGLWQSAVKISDGYSSVFNAAFGILFFVKVSAYINLPSQLKPFVRKSLLIISGISFISLSIIWLFKRQFLVLFYSPDFAKADRFLEMQLVGDIFKFPSWILGFVLMAQLRTKLYIFTQAFSALVYIILITVLMPLIGIDSLPLANAIRFLLYFLLLLYLLRKTIF